MQCRYRLLEGCIKVPARTSSFHISDILELNDNKPSQEETNVQGYKTARKVTIK